MKREIWKDVIGYDGLYQVSNLGDVKSCDGGIKGKVLSKIKSTTGYYRVTLCKRGKQHVCYVHRIVALAFINNPLMVKTVNHKDLNKLNNNVG